MKILHLETSSRNCSVSISEGKTLLSTCEEISESLNQSEKLHRFVEWALEGASIALSDLDVISLGKGPGSYTGLRIGASAAKGFCFGLELPLVASESIATLAHPFLGKEYDVVIPLIDARRMEVYTAAYDGATGKVLEHTTNKILSENTFEKYQGKKILFVGDGAKKAQELLVQQDSTFLSEVYPSSRYLVDPAVDRITLQQFEDVAYFEPFYLKDFHGVKKTK